MAFTEYLTGLKEKIAWIAETSYGSGGTMSSGEFVGLNAEIEPKFKQNWSDVLGAGSGARTIDSQALGPLSLSFRLKFIPYNWRFMKYCGYSVADGGGPAYTHTFTLADTITSFKLEWAKTHGTTDHVLTLTGCVVKSCTINFQKATGEGAEGFITVTLDCVAKAVSPGSSTTSISEITDNPFQWRHTKLTLNSTEITELNNGEITINNGIDETDSRYCNSTLDRALGEPIPKVHKISGRFNINIKDKTYYDFWDGAAAMSNTNKLEFIRGTNDDIDMTFTNMRIEEGVAPTVIDGVTNVDLVWMCESLSSFVATDAVATY